MSVLKLVSFNALSKSSLGSFQNAVLSVASLSFWALKFTDRLAKDRP